MEDTQETQGAETQHGWAAFSEKQVMLQLAKPYIGCTYTYAPSMDEERNVRATPVLSGTLHVQPDGGGGVLLVLQMPTGNGGDFALIAVKPVDVEYCTHIHQPRIVAP